MRSDVTLSVSSLLSWLWWHVHFPWPLLVFSSRLQSFSLLSSTVFSFLPLPFLLAVSSVVMSLKSRHMHQLPSTYLWPRLLSADFHPGTHLSLDHLIDTEAKLPSPFLTPVPDSSLSFLYSVDGKYTLLSRFLISLHQEVLVSLASNYNQNVTISHCAYCCLPTIVWMLEVPKLPLFGGSVPVLVLLGTSSVVRAVPGVTSHHFSAQNSAKAKVLTWITAFVSSPCHPFCYCIPASLLSPPIPLMCAPHLGILLFLLQKFLLLSSDSYLLWFSSQ